MVCIASSTSAQIFTFGKCSKVIVDENINLAEFYGKWYIVSDKCIQQIYGDDSRHETISIFNETIIIGNKVQAANKYTIIGTDYYSYAIIYSCKSSFIYNTESIWVLSRTADLDNEAYKKALVDLKRHKLSNAYWSQTIYDCKKFARQIYNSQEDPKKDVTTFFKYFLKIYKLVMKVFK